MGRGALRGEEREEGGVGVVGKGPWARLTELGIDQRRGGRFWSGNTKE